MSLKTRLLLTLVLAFLAILTIGGYLALEQARRSIANELLSAQTVAANRVAQLLAELPASRDVPGQIQGFVRSHNGDRDVRIMLIDPRGQVRAQSETARDYRGLPAWFVTLIAPPQPTRIIPLSGLADPITAVVVSIDPRNEIAETWYDLLYALAILVVFVLVAFVAVFVVVGRALAPLEAIESAYRLIGAGAADVRVEPRGPPEMKGLARGLNHMVERLGEAADANRRLSEQLQRLQDEERAMLARDLHDDVGPLLFAIDVEAGAIARKARGPDGEEDKAAGILERAKAIKASAHQARQAVRRILSELRPGTMPGLGLKAAIEDTVATLARRHPEVAFSLDAADASLPAPVEMTVFKAVREALTNALKHGEPGKVSVRIWIEAQVLHFLVDDDGGGLGAKGATGGFGLVGMRERLEAAGGALTVSQVPLPAGVRVEGRIPVHPAAEDRRAREGATT